MAAPVCQRVQPAVGVAHHDERHLSDHAPYGLADREVVRHPDPVPARLRGGGHGLGMVDTGALTVGEMAAEQATGRSDAQPGETERTAEP
jgi:hypothetical protein